MKKLASFALLGLLAILASVGQTSAAYAAPAPQIGLTVNRSVLFSGEHFTATASANVSCSWTLEWNGDRRRNRATDFVTTFTAPRVTRITKIPLHGTCFYTEPSTPRSALVKKPARLAGTAETLIVTVPPAWRRTIVITVVPPGGGVLPPNGPGGPGGLPNTGGPELWMLLLGLGSALLGTVFVRSVLRKTEV